MTRAPRNSVASITGATLEELQSRFPREWNTVGEALVAAAQTRRPEAMAAFMTRFHAAAKPWQARVAGRRVRPETVVAAVPHLAMARMAHLAAERTLQATAAQLATGKPTDILRFGRLGGWLVQRLLFARGLERKPVSRAAFRVLWPLVPRRRILMSLVGPRGIYCFYTRELVRALAALVGERSCLELAAGDGTLSRFLNAAGTPVRATDDRSWGHAIHYPEDVEDLDAATALARDQPRAVLCSFPPPANRFERVVFRTPSVEVYIVITTRHRHAAGDWEAYSQQTSFELTQPAALAGLVLPPELDPCVLVFRRTG
jgi:hypothetical protein